LNDPQTRGDLNAQQSKENNGVNVLISLGKRIRVVRIGEDARALKVSTIGTMQKKTADNKRVLINRLLTLLEVQYQFVVMRLLALPMLDLMHSWMLTAS